MSTEPVTVTIDDPLIETGQGKPAPEPQAPAPQPAPAAPAAPAAEGEAQTAKEGEPDLIAEMKARLEEAQKREAELAAQRDQLAQQAIEAQRRAQAAQANAQLSQYDRIVQALDASRQQMRMLQESLETAFAEGDGKRVAQIQANMALLAPRINDLENGKDALERQAERQRRALEARAAQPQVPQQVAADPFEAQIAHLSDPSKRWMRRNRVFVTTGDNMTEVIAAHHYATKRLNLTPDTPEYFEAVEAELGLRQPSEPAPQRRSLPSAPVSRTGGVGAQPARPNQVRLTPREQQIAAEMGMTNEEYARGKWLRDQKNQQQRMH